MQKSWDCVTNPMDMHIFRTASDAAFFQHLLETTESVRIRQILLELVVLGVVYAEE